MKTTQAICGAVVAALGLAALLTFYDEFKSSTQTPLHSKAVQKAESLTPANSIANDFSMLPGSSSAAISIAHDFAVLPESSTAASSIAQELDEPKSVHTVPVRPESPSPAQSAITVAPTPPHPPARVAAPPAVPATLPSHPEPVDVCARDGGHRVDFMRGRHAMWRCDYPRHR
jgi:hypothetical protein